MVAETQARMAASPVLYIVILSALILWMVGTVTGSLIRTRSQRRVDNDDRSQRRFDDDTRFDAQDQDDDSYWFFGVYNNPNDRSLYASTSFVRRGVNIGQPVGLAIMIIVILIFTVLDVVAILAVGK